jgi:ribosomal protein S18 acetylase RimI-like enzyme
VTERTRLLRAIAANHRALWRRSAGSRVDAGGLEVVISGDGGAIGFPPRRARTRESLDEVMRLGLRRMSCWSLAEDRAFGTLLLARGFEWGWQPHWMALDLARLADEEPGHAVVAERGGRSPIRRLTVGSGGRTVGHVLVNPWRGYAGIYDMGVVPEAQRRGIGRALTLAACRLGRDLGCSHAVLNATGEGEPLYRSVGFESQGKGRTWWLHPGRHPTPRQAALVEAIGFGDVEALDALDVTHDELEAPVPGGGPPLAIAVVTGQAAIAGWVLQRRPDLVSRPVEPRGGTLLHVAVEWDDEHIAAVALAHGADRAVRDPTWDGTPLDWAEFLGRPRMAALLRGSD